MLIIIYGEDTYRSREWLHELITRFKEKFDAPGYNCVSFNGNCDRSELRSAITAPPFLATKRMVVVERLFELKKKSTDDIEAALAQIPESTIVVVWEEGDGKTLQKIHFFEALAKKKTTKIYSFPALRGAELETWARARAKNTGVSFERGAIELLTARTGSDVWQLVGELDKFAANGTTTITRAMVEASVRGTTPENIFAFTDALSARNAKLATQTLANERENDVAVPYLITMLARQFRILREAQTYLTEHIGATAGELSQVFGWHPFVARKTLDQARKFSSEELAHACDALFDADTAIKTGALAADTALDLLVAKLLLRQGMFVV